MDKNINYQYPNHLDNTTDTKQQIDNVVMINFLFGLFIFVVFIRILGYLHDNVSQSSNINLNENISNDNSNTDYLIEIYEAEKYTDICPICIDVFEENQEIVKLECNHIYHKQCIEMWFQKKRICPLCNN